MSLEITTLFIKETNMQKMIREILEGIGEDPDRQGLKGTPKRVEDAFKFLTKGYKQDIAELLNGALYEEKYDEMVIVKGIDIFSLCEHHLLPFFGKCHVAYIPDGKLIGLSKIPRLVEVFARRLQVQERLTSEIAQNLQDILKPKGVAVVIEAKHLCMIMRGVEKQNTVATTSAMLGAFKSRQETRMEFMELISKEEDF
jgi:GTP cyclohydrolase I